MTEQQRRLSGLRVQAHYRVLGLEHQVAELVPLPLLLDVQTAEAGLVGRVVVEFECTARRPPARACRAGWSLL
jgi:hypothetical protein